ncbi:MAG: hypothetical protein IJS96_01900 [Schwartzia sp.]|nr:hypothetical protein [Schwartzia sp. (in: firmicutes)]
MTAGVEADAATAVEVVFAGTPDISIDGVLWEIKSPTGNSRHTMKHTLQKAAHQSNHVIVDLRRCRKTALPRNLRTISTCQGESAA